jgi:hypothetical protein
LVVLHAFRHVFSVVGAEPRHDFSFDVHFEAHVTPAPAAKQLGSAVSNVVRQLLPPVLRHCRNAALACRMQAPVAGLNGWGNRVVVVVVVATVVVVVAVWASPVLATSRDAITITAAPRATRDILASIARLRFFASAANVIASSPRISPMRRAGAASAWGSSCPTAG